MRRASFVAISIMVGFSAWTCLLAADEDAKVAVIREANRHSVQGIRTLHARYTTVQNNVKANKGSPEVWVSRNEWWQDGDKVRWSSVTEVPQTAAPKASKGKRAPLQLTREDGVVTGGDMQIQTQRRDEQGKWSPTSGTIKKRSRDEVITWDVWLVTLFVVQTEPRSTLADLMGEGAVVKRLPSEVVDNRPCDRLLVKPLNSKYKYEYDVLVDSRYNYLVRRLKPMTSMPGLIARYERSVNRFQECARGLYFPVEVETRRYAVKPGRKDELRTITRHTFTSVVANQPIDPSVFKLDFTPGTSIWDQRNQTSFIIGKDQKPAGPVVAMPPGGDTVAEPTYAEPQPFWTGPRIAIALGSTILVLAGGSWWLVRRGRRDSAVPTA